jgi:hypothetical protein
MSSSELRVTYNPAQWEEVICLSTKPLLPGYPDYLKTSVVNLYAPRYAARAERAHPVDIQGNYKDQWNSFDHYKIGQDETSGYYTYPLPIVPNSFGVHNSYGSYLGYTRLPYALYYSEFGEAGQLNNGLTGFVSERADGGFVPPPADLDKLVLASLASMLPVIKAELSIVNSIIELKDFESLPKTLKKIEEVTRKIPRTLRTLRQFFAGAADGYLQAKFNLLPLLSDISGIRTALSRTERRINDFITRSGRVQHRHYNRALTELVPTVDTAYGAAPSGTISSPDLAESVVYQRYTYPDPTIFHAEIEYNYNYTRYQLEHARILALYDALGFNLNPAIIWNAIPWSFVIDWVLGVSQWLSTQRIGFMDPKINILRYLWSVKRSRRIVVQRQVSVPAYVDGPYSVASGWVPLPTVRETAYSRVVGLPSEHSILTSGLNASEFSLAAALVIARKRPQHKRA